ncbi:alpha/beta-Hydrolases superfamily protein, partial [Prunus dulcis]
LPHSSSSLFLPTSLPSLSHNSHKSSSSPQHKHVHLHHHPSQHFIVRRMPRRSSRIQRRLHRPLSQPELRRPRPGRRLRLLEGRRFRPDQSPPTPPLQASSNDTLSLVVQKAPHLLLHPRRRLLHRLARLAQLPELLLPASFPAPVRRRFARLSPRSEHRLPAAIHDGAAALQWLRAQAEADEPDTWLTDVADFENVFVSGDSAGGNIAHNLAVRFGPGSTELGPVRVRGYLLLAPFFAGTVLSKSEAEGPKDAFLNWELIDRFWRLSIPIGENTDHPLVNPFGPFSRSLEPVALDPILVVVGGSDLLRDRAEDYAKRLKNWGKKVEYVEFEGEQHGFFTFHPNSQAAKDLMPILKRFITENSS